MYCLKRFFCFGEPVKKVIVLLFFIFSFDLHAKYNIVSDFTLNNGLRIVCIDKKELPIVCCSVFYKCGSINETPSKSGIAHFLEHMAFCGDNGAFSDFLENAGAEDNAFTSFRTICFYEIVPINHLETVFKYESRRMEFMDINKEKFLSEKGAILEERSMRCDNIPQGQYLESIDAALFNRMSGGIHPIGWRHEIESTEPQDLIDFHDKWFAPNNAVILIVGDINIAKIKSLAEKYFAKIKSKEIAKINDDAIKPKEIKKIELKSSKIGTEAEVNYTYFVPFSVKDNFRKSMALFLVSQMLNQPTSFAKKTLENSLNKATSISFDYDYGAYQYDIFRVSIACSSVDNLSECEELWGYLKRKILISGITQTELETVKRQRAMSLAYRDQDIRTISEHIWWDMASGFTLEQIQSMDDVIQSITLEECKEALNEVLKPQYIAVSRILPKEHDRD